MRLVDRTLRIAVTVVLGLVLIYIGSALLAARMVVFPWWYKKDYVGQRLPDCSTYQKKVYLHCSDPRRSLGLDFVEFNADRGDVRTSGWWVYAPLERVPEGTVVLVHGGGTDRRAMLRHAAYLHRAGFHTLLIDCHNHGLNKSDDRGVSFGLREAESVVAAVRWATLNVDPGTGRPVFVMGTSQGAFAALRGAALSDLVRAVVAENPYISAKRLLREFPALTWLPRFIKEGALVFSGLWLGVSLDRLDVRDFSDALTDRPVLLIHGDADVVVDPAHSKEIYGLLTGPKELWLVKGGEHEYVWNIAPSEYEDRVVRFLRRFAR